MNLVACPMCHGEGCVGHRVFAAGASPFDHTDWCDGCKRTGFVTETRWKYLIDHPRLNPCRPVQTAS